MLLGRWVVLIREGKRPALRCEQRVSLFLRQHAIGDMGFWLGRGNKGLVKRCEVFGGTVLAV